jgi:hypothetical protein
MPKGKLRVDKNDQPIIVVVNQIQLYCHNEVEEGTKGGKMVHIKMRPSSKFIDKFNGEVLEMLDFAIQSARDENRTDLLEEDAPFFAE